MAETRQRMKQKDLVAALFVLFSEEYDSSGADSILDLELPMSLLRERLRDRFGIGYTSDAWIGTQLRKYEEEEGVTLFRRRDGGDGALLGIARDMRSYSQKRHLYVTQKIKVANGVLDLIANEGAALSGEGVGILLGAGSTITRIAEAMADRIKARRPEGRTKAGPAPGGSLGPAAGPEGEPRWRVATHNVGAMLALGGGGQAAGLGPAGVELLVPEGRLDPSIFAIIGRNDELYARLRLDWSVEGTSFLCAGRLYVENAEEAAVKAAVLRRVSGRKILVLTGHEAVEAPPPGLESYGSIRDCDFVVLPRAPKEGRPPSRFELAIRELGEVLEPWVLNWNYEILRVRRKASDAAR